MSSLSEVTDTTLGEQDPDGFATSSDLGLAGPVFSIDAAIELGFSDPGRLWITAGARHWRLDRGHTLAQLTEHRGPIALQRPIRTRCQDQTETEAPAVARGQLVFRPLPPCRPSDRAGLRIPRERPAPRACGLGSLPALAPSLTTRRPTGVRADASVQLVRRGGWGADASSGPVHSLGVEAEVEVLASVTLGFDPQAKARAGLARWQLIQRAHAVGLAAARTCTLAVGSPPSSESPPTSPDSPPTDTTPVPNDRVFSSSGARSSKVEDGPQTRQDPGDIVQAALSASPGPSLEQAQAAALARAGLDPEAPRRWRRRARVAAVLPTFTTQYDHRLDRGWTLDREVGNPDALRDDGQSQDTLRFKATWSLDRLIYSPEELRIARAHLDLEDWRTRVSAEVTALYVERLGLLTATALAPAPDIEEALTRALRLRELEGLLAALTGLEFSRS